MKWSEKFVEYTETLDLLIEFLINITNDDKGLVLAVCNPLETEKMQREMMDWLVENYKNKELMDESHLIEKTLQIIGVI